MLDEQDKSTKQNNINFRQVPSANGIIWLTKAFYLFKKNPLAWFSGLLLMILILFILMLIPIVNFLVVILTPVFSAGFMVSCLNIKQNRVFKLGLIFSGFKQNFNPLLIVGLIYLGYTLICSFLAVEISAYLDRPIIQATPEMITSGTLDIKAFLESLILPTLILMGLMLPMFMATWFAPALIVFANLKPIEALKQSFNACRANLKPFTSYGLVGLAAILLIILIFGLISLLIPALGILLNLSSNLFFMSIFFASMFTSYEDIFNEIETNNMDQVHSHTSTDDKDNNDDGPSSIII